MGRSKFYPGQTTMRLETADSGVLRRESGKDPLECFLGFIEHRRSEARRYRIM